MIILQIFHRTVSNKKKKRNKCIYSHPLSFIFLSMLFVYNKIKFTPRSIRSFDSLHDYNNYRKSSFSFPRKINCCTSDGTMYAAVRRRSCSAERFQFSHLLSVIDKRINSLAIYG